MSKADIKLQSQGHTFTFSHIKRIFGLEVLGASITNQTWSVGVVQNNVPLQCAF